MSCRLYIILLLLIVIYLTTIECKDIQKKSEKSKGKQLKQNSKDGANTKMKNSEGIKSASRKKVKQNSRRKKKTRTRRKKNELEEYDLTEIINEYIRQKKKPVPSSTDPPRQLSNPTKIPFRKMPKDLKPEHFAEFQIPNPKFCEDRQLNAAHNYFIHPWWYDYCMRIKEKQEKKLGLEYTLLPVYRRVLDRVQKYKKMKQHQLSQTHHHSG